jgi:threonine synthase
VKDSEGTALSVSEEEILQAQGLLASLEGVFGEPSGVAGIAGVKELRESGIIDGSDTVVVPITGTGFKDPEVVVDAFPTPRLVSPLLEEIRDLGPSKWNHPDCLRMEKLR